MNDWKDNVDFAMTVCDAEGKITLMNAKAAATFAKSGGAELVGKSLLDCHPEPSKTKLKDLLSSPRLNAYTIEKNGVKKLIYQAPVMEGGKLAGIVELSLPLPAEMPHFVRKP
ncbi:MAG: PAS domain-containing protein [Elusimicrobia bacterium]|nr:PAS domain-containing protein [Elusimicrobiota bacterium]